MQLILASQSPYRRQQLKSLGLNFICIKPLVDEEKLKAQLQLKPHDLALALAKAKAQSVFATHPNSIVIGSDQLVNFNGSILGKAGTKEQAYTQLKHLSGKTHELITALTLISPLKTFSHVDITRMHMRNLSEDEIRSYIDYAHPLDCAGSYKLELGGFALMDKIESQDQSAIIGLPLIKLSHFLKELGTTFFIEENLQKNSQDQGQS